MLGFRLVSASGVVVHISRLSNDSVTSGHRLFSGELKKQDTEPAPLRKMNVPWTRSPQTNKHTARILARKCKTPLTQWAPDLGAMNSVILDLLVMTIPILFYGGNAAMEVQRRSLSNYSLMGPLTSKQRFTTFTTLNAPPNNSYHAGLLVYCIPGEPPPPPPAVPSLFE